MDADQLVRLRELSRIRCGIGAAIDQLVAYVADSNGRCERIVALLHEHVEVLKDAFDAANDGGPLWDRRVAELIELKQRMVALSRKDNNYGEEQ